MPDVRVVPNDITYNAVVDATCDMSAGYMIFSDVRMLNVLPNLVSNGYQTLGLHDMSCGAAVLPGFRATQAETDAWRIAGLDSLSLLRDLPTGVEAGKDRRLQDERSSCLQAPNS